MVHPTVSTKDQAVARRLRVIERDLQDLRIAESRLCCELLELAHLLDPRPPQLTEAD